MGVRTSFMKSNVRACLAHAEQAGYFSYNVRERCPDVDPDLLHEELVDEQGHVLEVEWEDEYERRRTRMKNDTMIAPDISQSAGDCPVGRDSKLNDGSAFREAFERPMTMLPGFRQDIPASEPDRFVDIESMIKEYTLNAEQERAFRIVAGHSMDRGSELLRMFLNGPGGTGKSRVISALHDFFERRNQGRRFRLASYTGVAARNISGMTLDVEQSREAWKQFVDKSRFCCHVAGG